MNAPELVGPSEQIAAALSERVIDAIQGFPATNASEKQVIAQAVAQRVAGHQFEEPATG